MKKHLLPIGIMVGLGVLAAVIIVITTPGKSNNTGTPTPVANNNPNLKSTKIDGHIIFSLGGSLWEWNGDKIAKLPLVPGNSVIANQTVRLIQPALSPDGKRLAFIREDETFSDLWVANADGSNAKSLTAHKGKGVPRSANFLSSSNWAFQPAWSPDGSEIAFLGDYATDDLALWSTNSTQYRSRPLSRGFAIGVGGIQRSGWSNQADFMAITATREGKSQIYSLKPTTGTTKVLTESADGAYDPAFSPEGKQIAYITRRGSSSELWLMQADGTNPTLLTRDASRQPVFSPDGSKIAYLNLREGGFEIFIQSLPAAGQPASQPTQISQNARLSGNDGLTWR